VTPPEEGGHVVRITPQSAHNVGNLSIRLVDLITPITFTLQTGLDEVDYRFDARIPKQGPLAKVPLIENGGLKSVVGGDENLVQILDGTPPTNSEKLKIEGTDGRSGVWRLAGRIYLRTPLTLLSPAWSSSVTSADGMNVYVLNDTPVILLSDEGRVVKAHIAASEVAP
jgi:intracellular multiplication protein IcmK